MVLRFHSSTVLGSQNSMALWLQNSMVPWLYGFTTPGSYKPGELKHLNSTMKGLYYSSHSVTRRTGRSKPSSSTNIALT